jgi:hypothetical protein
MRARLAAKGGKKVLSIAQGVALADEERATDHRLSVVQVKG